MANIYKKQSNFESAIGVYQRILVIRDFNNPDNDSELNKESYRNMGQLAETYMFDGQFKIAAGKSSLSLSLRLKGLFLYTIGVVFHVEWCIRHF